ncbi:MAG: amidohydrolase family protein [Halodesulfurarchaeum sp.]|nr:amidohydrolase family protein [Halodesulfurarchaeum sp.]
MAAPADTIFVDGEVHVDPGEDRTEEALAVRDGTVCRIADTYEVEFLEGIETRRVDLDGRTVLPGFVDGHADLFRLGQRLRGSEDGSGTEPTGVEHARSNLTAAFDALLDAGITTVFDEVRHPETARAYYELALADELPIRGRLSYRENAVSTERPTPLEAVRTLGLVSGVGNDRLAIDSLGIDASDRPTTAVQDFVERATETGFRVSATAADAPALERLLSALDGDDANQSRLWLDGGPSEEHVQALADLGATVVGRPGPMGESDEQETAENGGDTTRDLQFGPLVAAGVPVAFGSDGSRPAPLRDVERSLGASPDTRLGVTAALRAATGGTGMRSPAGSSIGTLDVGAPADFVVLSASPWETPVADLAVELTVVDGSIEYDRLG